MHCLPAFKTSFMQKMHNYIFISFFFIFLLVIYCFRRQSDETPHTRGIHSSFFYTILKLQKLKIGVKICENPLITNGYNFLNLCATINLNAT